MSQGDTCMILSEVHVGAAAGDAGNLSLCEDHFITRVRYLSPLAVVKAAGGCAGPPHVDRSARDASAGDMQPGGSGSGSGTCADASAAGMDQGGSGSGSAGPCLGRDRDGDLLLRRPRRTWRDLAVHHTLSTDLGGVGQQLWRGAFLLADHLLQHPGTVAGRHVVELGAGVGLLSIVAAIAGAAHVFCTDHDPGALRLAALTVAEHAASGCMGCAPVAERAASGCMGCAPVAVRALDWFAPLPLPPHAAPCAAPASPFSWVVEDGPAWAATSVILCADCVYDTAATRALFRTMEAIARCCEAAGSGVVALCALVRVCPQGVGLVGLGHPRALCSCASGYACVLCACASVCICVCGGGGCVHACVWWGWLCGLCGLCGCVACVAVWLCGLCGSVGMVETASFSCDAKPYLTPSTAPPRPAPPRPRPCVGSHHPTCGCQEKRYNFELATLSVTGGRVHSVGLE